MSLKLEELRKRLLQQPLGENPASSASAPLSVVALPEREAKIPEQTPSKSEGKAAESDKSAELPVKTIEIGAVKDRDRKISKNDPPTSLPGGAASVSPIVAAKLDSQPTPDAVAESVAKLFEQTKTFQVRFDELAQAVDLIERMTDSATRLFGPLRSFHGQLSQLAVSFESMRAFQAQLAQLGKSFEPMKLLHDQLSQLSEGVQSHLAQLVKALDPAKDFRDRILALAHSLDEATKLQAEFGELYSTFRAGGGKSDSASAQGLIEVRRAAN
jgi:ABC-type transporter Mla subunit MlaD